MWDRIIQQCILQVLEPICEAKFHKHSYGFRPNRSTHHAKARFELLINMAGFYHCVDVDIKGFFDNVNHSKLLKQLESIGIKDKSILFIISKLLKAEIEGEGVSTKGTPQGGILSPLLSNVFLNELDWWVSNQWETFKCNHDYKHSGSRVKELKRTKLKECYIVRYADDFKVLCRTRSQAIKLNYAIRDFLKNRLHLDTSEENNLKRSSSEFLGFSFRAIRKGKTRHGFVAQSNMTKKAKSKALIKIKDSIKTIQKKPSAGAVWRYNTVVMHSKLLRTTTNISNNLSELPSHLNKTLYNRLTHFRTEAKFNDMKKRKNK